MMVRDREVGGELWMSAGKKNRKCLWFMILGGENGCRWKNMEASAGGGVRLLVGKSKTDIPLSAVNE